MTFGKYYNLFGFLSEGDKQEGEMKVNIHLVDVNDNYPKLQWKQNFICMQDMTPLTLTAVDKDSDPYGEPFTFSINRKSPNFEIKPVDGEQTISLTLTLKQHANALFTLWLSSF